MFMYKGKERLFTIRRPAVIVLAFFLLGKSFAAEASENTLGSSVSAALGEPVEHYVSSIVSPDGSGLPDGSGSVAEGKQVYETQCAACHGIDGDTQGNRLVGGIGTLSSARPIVTVGSYWPYATILYDYIARAMPYGQAQTLAADEVYAVTAYILHLNGILSDSAELDALSLVEVDMPNKDGFVELPGMGHK
jgi:S-disulfanyl-L-cysteine oxidoreductase SoxD